MPVQTLRDTFRRILPPWLQTGIAEKLTYAMGVQFDALADAAVEAVRIRFPGFSVEALPYLGRERRIRRGPNEPAEVYAKRLTRWLDDHATRGGPYALLEQLFAYYSQAPFPIELVYYSGRRYSLDVDGNITMDDVDATPDSDSARWPRWWLFFHWPTAIGDDGEWDDPGTWDDGGVWDYDLTTGEVEDLKVVPTEWNAAHAKGTLILLGGGGELWDYPQGTWDEPSDAVWDGGSIVRLPIAR